MFYSVFDIAYRVPLFSFILFLSLPLSLLTQNPELPLRFSLQGFYKISYHLNDFIPTNKTSEGVSRRIYLRQYKQLRQYNEIVVERRRRVDMGLDTREFKVTFIRFIKVSRSTRRKSIVYSVHF